MQGGGLVSGVVGEAHRAFGVAHDVAEHRSRARRQREVLGGGGLQFFGDAPRLDQLGVAQLVGSTAVAVNGAAFVDPHCQLFPAARARDHEQVGKFDALPAARDDRR